MLNYTKGEWEYLEEPRANMSMISGGETIVCGLPNPVSGEPAEWVEMRANAQLISQAPRMYEALKYLTETVARFERYTSDNSESYRMATEAIAKVERG